MRTVEFPLTSDLMSPLGPRCKRVQFDTYTFSTPPTDIDLVRLAEFLRGYPDVALRIFGHPSSTTDLELLRHFSFLKRFHCEIFELRSLEGVRYLPDGLREFGLGRTRRRFPLGFIKRFRGLEDLYLEGHSKEFDAVGELTNLEELTLRSVTIPSLEPLAKLSKLWWLDIKLGGTRNLTGLQSLTGLKYLELWRIRGFDDLNPVSDLSGLQYLFLEDLSRVTRLPSMAKLGQLRRLDLWNLSRLQDLSPLMEARALEELGIGARHLQREDFEILKNHPSLKRLSVGTGSARRDREIVEMLGLSESTSNKWQFDFR